MKHVMTWIQRDKSFRRMGKWRYNNNADYPIRNLMAQVDNSINFGQKPEDIIICTNFDFQYRGITNYRVQNVNPVSAWLNKSVAVFELIENGILKDDVWIHDLDAWQVHPFTFPDNGIGFDGSAEYIHQECGDVACPIFHGPGRPQGAVIFYKSTGLDIAREVYRSVLTGTSSNDEVHMKHIYRAHGVRNKDNPTGRWTILNRSWCGHLGQTSRMDRPWFIVHYKPDCGERPGYLEPLDGWQLVTEPVKELFVRYKLLPKAGEETVSTDE